jgi:hypothetical protein
MRIVEATTISMSQKTLVLPIAEALRRRGEDLTLLCSDTRESISAQLGSRRDLADLGFTYEKPHGSASETLGYRP